ncbi:hypothetical protein DPMN_104410 [Dreissena polymorpha]|uniref:Phosphodiesterase n=1 Tax=Dreissena polymorpha TaxID=45954 RepID=A0A9D4HBY5_DREPO|nr:hypothetical protein DPMN_104410 [Dreissena polymorpha]
MNVIVFSSLKELSHQLERERRYRCESHRQKRDSNNGGGSLEDGRGEPWAVIQIRISKGWSYEDIEVFQDGGTQYAQRAGEAVLGFGKNGDHFTLEDESAFKLFAIYCALALHYSRIYTLLSHKHMKYQVAMDVLNYHISCSDDEYKALLKAPEIAENLIPADFDTYDFCCYDYTEHLPKLFIKLIQETFTNTFEMRKLCRFILTVRKNYRPVQYHNWEHGFHVGHSLWQMIRKCKFQFTNLEKMALIIGGVCHDIDHRGYNNDFFKKLKLPLAALYSTSLMEEHHYKQMITILHAEGHEIFSFLTADEHRLILDYIRKNIIATDLSLYFTNQKFLTGLIERKEFNPEVGAHRHGLLALMMTGADLCAIAKPWHTQQRTAKFIYDEFFMQGDEEKKRGLQPIPMMDRHYQDDIPKNQIGFISFICKPLYTTLSVLLPGTKRLLDGTITSMDKWKVEMEEQKAAREKATKEQSARAE